MKKTYLWLLSLLSGVLLALAWPANGFAPLALVALVPLFAVDDFVLERQTAQAGLPKKERIRYHIFGYSYLAFVVWNALTTWWIWYSTPAALLAVTLNALLMACVFTLFHFSCRVFFKGGKRWFILFVYWLGFEFFHHNWDVSWPWLTLGNVFANYPAWVQWYEMTGVLGGSLWILACNALFWHWLRTWRKNRKEGLSFPVRPLAAILLLVLVPLTASLLRYRNYEPQGEPVEVVTVQPNIDPYREQFHISAREAATRMLDLAALQLTPQTRFIVTPESMLQENIWDDELHLCPSVIRIQRFLQDWKNVKLMAGISSYSHVLPQDSAQAGIRRLRREDDPFLKFYKAHNSVIVIGHDRNAPIPLYHKSKLTPGVEIMPFAGKLRFIEKMAVNMGGTTGTLGIDPEPKVFGDSVKFTDVICYESIFGDYVAWSVRKGAQLLFVSTNDGWWKNSPGHRQHAAYARLRAIENRREVARSANTGISCFIDQKGQVFQATAYGEPDCIRQTLLANSKLTFYSKYGDILGRGCLPFALLIVLLSVVYRRFPNALKRGA
ncbi:MAG: apolipoprotein N-acyltransferase [Bacteroides sp.]|nr:apolipoprotein N-acyltransferase [Ruminococcus flavefaciens]MCM1555107.1 apolipoprotein N-acyltransferase [Bacteroides sp.]